MQLQLVYSLAGLCCNILILSGYLFIHVYIYTYIYKVKLATVVESDQKATFSIATTPKCKGGRYFFPRIAPLYLSYIPYIAEC